MQRALVDFNRWLNPPNVDPFQQSYDAMMTEYDTRARAPRFWAVVVEF